MPILPPRGGRVFPRLLSGYTLDAALVVFSALCFASHPGFAGLPASAAALPARVAALVPPRAAAGANATAAHAASLAAAYEYVLGSDLGGAAANVSPSNRDFYALAEWKNGLFLPAAARRALPHVAAIYARNYIAILIVYFGFGAAWAAFFYWAAADTYFPADAKTGKRSIPSWAAVRAQMWVSVCAMPFYVLMPTASEWLMERGLTRAVHSFAELGGAAGWVASTAAFLFLVEWAIYWIHRGLHESRTAYRWLHADHHTYNNAGDLSPFAGLAFHPLDGMLQASPYLLFSLAVPVHAWTLTALLFFTGVWTTNIHDTVPGDTEPVMGAKYHTYHHTAYKDNYGQFFVFFDWVHDTLHDPTLRPGYGAVDARAAADARGTAKDE